MISPLGLARHRQTDKRPLPAWLLHKWGLPSCAAARALPLQAAAV